MAEVKPILVSKRVPYVPILSEVEHKAYAAAHRLVSHRPRVDYFATPGARHSATVDHIARIIMEIFAEEETPR